MDLRPFGQGRRLFKTKVEPAQKDFGHSNAFGVAKSPCKSWRRKYSRPKRESQANGQAAYDPPLHRDSLRYHLDRTNVGGRALRSFHATLVARRRRGSIAGINGGTTEHRQVRVGRAAVILERSQHGIDTGQVARLVQTAGAVAVEVKTSRDKVTRLRKAFVAIFGKRLPGNDYYSA
jgi:hypothetical protein